MRTTVVTCDRCGQQPLPAPPVHQLSMTPEIAKEMPEIVQTSAGGYGHSVDLCKPCAEKFLLFMKNSDHLERSDFDG
jgi:hypothetical protein